MNRWIICLSMAVGGFTATAQSIKIRTEKNVDLTQYETFTVLQGESVTPKDEKKATDKALFDAVKAGVRREMEDRGYKYVEDSTAQLTISYVAGSFNLTDAGNVGPLGQAPADDPSQLNQSRSWSNTSREGMLVLEMVDRATKKEVWKAETDDVPLSRAEISRALDAVIYKAFKKFPSREAKKKKKK